MSDDRAELRRAVREGLATVPSSGNSGLWLLVSLVLFVLAGSNNQLVDLVVLMVVIAIHEGGHAAAMKAFGYQDLKVFFVPFFGGAASGRKTGAPIWQQTLVLFAGPMPGIALGAALFAIAAFVLPGPAELLLGVGLKFVLINGFNLLPFPPLDGGRVVEISVFSRHRVLELGFSLLSGLLLAAGALGLQSIALGILAFFALVSLPTRASIRTSMDAVRATQGTLPSDATKLSDANVDALLDATLTPQGRAPNLRAVWERAAVPPPTARESVAIVAGWGAAWGALFGVVALYIVVAADR